jgi:hypothetical protein
MTNDISDEGGTELDAQAGEIAEGDVMQPGTTALDEGGRGGGYGKPPKHSQFKPGQSGNPRGRAKGARGLGALIKTEMNERVTITENGKAKRVSKLQVVIKALAAKAAKGDVNAADKLLALIIQSQGFEDERKTAKKLSESDQDILDRFLSAGPADSATIPDPDDFSAPSSDANADEAPETETLNDQFKG